MLNRAAQTLRNVMGAPKDKKANKYGAPNEGSGQSPNSGGASPSSAARSTEAAQPIVAFLRSVPLFNRLTYDDLKVMGKAMLPRKFKAGENVIKQGDEGHEFFVIVDGEAEVTVHGQGVVFTYHPGDFFGERAILNHDRRAATVTATRQLKVLVLNQELFDSLNLRDKVAFPQRQAVIAERFDVYNDEVLELVPKKKEDEDLIKNVVSHEDVLRGVVDLTDQLLDDLAAVASRVCCNQGDEIVTYGDTDAAQFYIIASGSVKIQVPRGAETTADGSENHGTVQMMLEASQDQGFKTISVQKAGTCFGIVALLYGTPRTAAVVAREDCVLWTISRKAFKTILMKSRAAHLNEYITFMDQVEGLEKLSLEEKRGVAQAMVEVYFNKNDVVIREGEPGSSLYFVYKGEVDAYKNGEIVKHYTAGGFFGERALLNNEPRAATVKCASDHCQLLMIDAESFAIVRNCIAEGKPRATYNHLIKRAKTTYFGKIEKNELDRVGYIGVGGFGAVTLEREKKTGEIYALKALSKGHLVQNEMTVNAILEKDILMMCDSHFIIRLYNTYKDRDSLYFLLEACIMGDLYLLLHRHKLYGKEPCAAYYSAVVLEAFRHLHDKRVLYRDLKPENVLMKADGTCKLCDFGIAKVVVGQTYTLCGTPEYMAPEVIRNKGHSLAVDWWCLGIFIHELIVGSTPFAASSTMAIYKAVNKGIDHVNFSSRLKPFHRELIVDLCVAVPSRRIPMVPGGMQLMKKNDLWKDLDWEMLSTTDYKPPFVPPAVTPESVCKGRVNERDVKALQVKFVDDGSEWDKEF